MPPNKSPEPLALAVPLSRFTPRVGGGSAFYVRHHSHYMKTFIIIGFTVVVLVVGSLLFWHYRNLNKHPSDSAVRQELPGTWVEAAENGITKTMMIGPDGHTTIQISGQATGRLEGTELVQDGYLITTITNSSLTDHVPYTNRVRVIRMDDNALVLQGLRNTPEEVFKKVQP